MSCQVEADLPAGLSCLKNVDALLHCPICFDFFNISMMTKCSHNFCSLCIRKFLSYKPHCPVCNAHATETDLRNNRILDELVVNFQAARQQLSKQNFESPPISPTTTASEVKYKTPRKRAQKSNGAVLSHFFQKKSKTSPTAETHRDGSISQWVQRGKIQTTLSYCANDGDLHLASPHRPAAVKEEPMDVEVASVHRLMSVKQEDSVSHSVTARDDVAHSSSPSQDVKPTIKVECPVCSVSVSKQFINKHLDTCLTSGEKKESLRSSLTRTRHPMNKLVYNLLSVHELKRRLKECHLSTQGSRDQMIKRHQEFVHIYNSQCDSLNPKSAEDIAKEVEANERMKNQLQGKAKPVMVFTKNHTEKEIDEMHSNYRKQHSSDFSRLIAQVRGRLETTRQTRIKEEAGVTVERDNVKIPSADLVAESKSCSAVKTESEEDDEEPLVRGIVLSPSPSYSDVSISSSISDIFGPEPARNIEDMEESSVQTKRTSSSDQAVSSPIPGKRKRKSSGEKEVRKGEKY